MIRSAATSHNTALTIILSQYGIKLFEYNNKCLSLKVLRSIILRITVSRVNEVKQTYCDCAYKHIAQLFAAVVLVGCLSVSGAVQTMEGVDVMACNEHLRLRSVLKYSRSLVSD